MSNKNQKFLDIWMIFSFSLASIETFIYFYGISNLNHLESLNYFNIIKYFFQNNFIDGFLIYFTLLLLAMLTVKNYRKNINIKGTKKINLKDIFFESFEFLIFTNFVYRFILGFNINDLSSIIIPSIISLTLYIFYYLFLRHFKNKFLNEHSLFLIFLWFLSFSIIIKLYVNEFSLYDANRVNDYGYIKDLIFLTLLLFMIGIIPNFSNYCFERYKITKNNIYLDIIKILLIGIILLSFLVIYFELDFPKTEMATIYIIKLLKLQEMELSNKIINEFKNIMNWHIFFRTVVFIMMFIVLPNIIIIIKKIIIAPDNSKFTISLKSE